MPAISLGALRTLPGISGVSGIPYTPSTDYGSASTGFNITPGPQTGVGAYGAVPGAIGIPPSYWQQMQSIYPVTPQATAASNIIGKQMAGELTPEEIATYQRLGAQFGAGITGGPTQFSGRQGLASVGRKVSDVQQQGILNYEAMLKALSGTLTPQELAAQIASRNATMAAAPDPQAAAEQQMRDWMEKFQMAMQAATPQTRTYGGVGSIRSPAGGTYDPFAAANKAYLDQLQRDLAASYGRGSTSGTKYAPTTPADQYEVQLPPGSYPQTDQYGNLSYTQPEDWWLEGYATPGDYDYANLYGEGIPPGSYASSDYYGNLTYSQPEDWWTQGYASPEDYDVAQYPGWYEDVGWYDYGD